MKGKYVSSGWASNDRRCLPGPGNLTKACVICLMLLGEWVEIRLQEGRKPIVEPAPAWWDEGRDVFLSLPRMDTYM
jgi:hypothetical protein